MSAAPLPGPAQSTVRSPRARAELRLVPAPARRPRAPFVALILTLLALGLLALLMLNTVLAQDAFRLHDLQRRGVATLDRQQELAELLARQRSPALLAPRAAALGMVPGSAAGFLRLADGRVVAVLSPAPHAAAPARPKVSGPPAPAAGAGAAPAHPPAITAAPAATKPGAPARPTPSPTASRR